jgi:hypothetical protein
MVECFIIKIKGGFNMEQRYFISYLNGYGWFDTEEDILDFITMENIDINNIREILYIPYVEDIKNDILGK